MILKVKFTSAYKKSYKLMKKRGLDLSLLEDVINTSGKSTGSHADLLNM